MVTSAFAAQESESPRAQTVRIKLHGANKAAEILGEERLESKANYYIGNDPNHWYTNIPLYRKVRYTDAYPGVDMVCYGSGGQPEYDFIVSPGADPAQIMLDLEGIKELGLDAQGDIVLSVCSGQITMRKPRVYQMSAGGEKEIPCRYRIYGKQRIGFDIGPYDADKLLVIDPALTYGTYLDGTMTSYGRGIAVDSSGCVYVAGYTASTDFPVKGAYQATYAGSTDTFITKINAAGTDIIYSTYLGGTSTDGAYGIAVDSTGCAYVAATPNSTNFPVVNAFQPIKGGDVDAYVAKLSAAAPRSSIPHISGDRTRMRHMESRWIHPAAYM